MKFKVSATVLLLVLAGCAEESGPVSPLLEQAVFASFGGLDAGETLTFSGSNASDILVGGSNGDYLAVAFHSSAVRGSKLQVGVEGNASSRVPQQTFGAAGGQFQVDANDLRSWNRHEELMRAQHEAMEPMIRPLQNRIANDPTFDLRPGRPNFTRAAPAVGDLLEINAAAVGNPCETVVPRTGRVEAVSERAIVVDDIGNPANGFTRAEFESFAERFDSLVDPTVREYFSDPTDIDQNGRVIIFFTRAVNELTEDPSDGFVAGFFYARDLFPSSGPGACGASNEGEIFFVLAPDPLGEASPLQHQTDVVFQRAVGTIGHEYQHLINAGRRIYINDAQAFEEVWLNEGMSHIAEELLFYEESGLSPETNVDLDLIRSTNAILAAANQFAVSNLVRYGLFLEEASDQAPTNTNDSLETRGAAWSYLRYLADQADRSNQQFFLSLVNSPLSGLDNLSSLVGGSILDTFREWGVSVYTDDAVLGGDDWLQQPSWNFRSVLPALFDDFPLVTETLDANGEVAFDLVATGSGYIEVEPDGDGVLRLSVDSGGATPPSALTVTIVRLN